MDRFRPILPQTNYFLDPLQQLASPNGNEEFVALGVDPLKNSPSTYTENNHFTHSKSRNFVTKMAHAREENPFGNMSYIEEWELVCKCGDLAQFRSWGFGGDLSASRFRSVCWRVYLGVFPAESSKWLSIIRSKRENYEQIRHEFMVTPGMHYNSLDPNVDNPLSQDEESPWNQYFEDFELKRLIRLDVERTFPEVDFFHSQRIQDMLVYILFCYARKYPKISYIQGMHEVLAPVSFILNYDHHVHANSNREGPSNKLLTELMDEAYLEHDSFTIFEAVMEKLHPWYEDGNPKRKLSGKKIRKEIVTQPFARPQEVGPTTKIVQKLTRIYDELVHEHEPEVYEQLSKMEIPPQVYGIRWVRLMFGREFTFSDVFLIWDAIFADSYSNFILIEYLVVAMLSYIKDKLIGADYVNTLKLLMKYPPSSDVHSIVQTALYFRNPKGNSRPVRCVNAIPSSMTTVGGQPNIHRAPQTHHGAISRSASVPRPSTVTASTLKHRSTSVDQHSRAGTGTDRRKSSPTLDVSPNVLVHNSGTTASTSTTTATRVVSGLARLGEKLGARPKEPQIQPSENVKDKFCLERQMDELKFQERSPPIKAQLILRDGSNAQPSSNSDSSSSEEEDDPAFPQKSIVSSQRVSVDDVLAVSLGCALKLSHHHEALANRFSQLHIANDFTIRAAMEGIAEAIENLRGLKSKSKRNCKSIDLPKSLPAFTHPLMDSESKES